MSGKMERAALAAIILVIGTSCTLIEPYPHEGRLHRAFGTIVDEGGEPIEGAAVRVTGQRPPGGDWTRTAVTDPEGRWEASVFPGPLLVVAAAEGRYPRSRILPGGNLDISAGELGLLAVLPDPLTVRTIHAERNLLPGETTTILPLDLWRGDPGEEPGADIVIEVARSLPAGPLVAKARPGPGGALAAIENEDALYAFENNPRPPETGWGIGMELGPVMGDLASPEESRGEDDLAWIRMGRGRGTARMEGLVPEIGISPDGRITLTWEVRYVLVPPGGEVAPVSPSLSPRELLYGSD